MFFESYKLAENQPIRMPLLRIPLIDSHKEWLEDDAQGTQIVTLDISQRGEETSILLGRPDWEDQGIDERIEGICSHLLLLMEGRGLVKNREKVSWFKMISVPAGISFQSIHFQDNGTWLSEPRWESVSISDFPFNVDCFKQFTVTH